MNIKTNYLTQPLRSTTITAASSLIRVAPSQFLASVLSPLQFSCLDFSLIIKTTGSRSSLQKPESKSCPLYTGHHSHSHQASCELIPGRLYIPGFDVTSGFRCIHKGSSSFIFLIHTCQSYTPAFLSTLMTITLNDSHLKWFEAYS